MSIKARAIHLNVHGLLLHLGLSISHKWLAEHLSHPWEALKHEIYCFKFNWKTSDFQRPFGNGFTLCKVFIIGKYPDYVATQVIIQFRNSIKQMIPFKAERNFIISQREFTMAEIIGHKVIIEL